MVVKAGWRMEGLPRAHSHDGRQTRGEHKKKAKPQPESDVIGIEGPTTSVADFLPLDTLCASGWA